MEKEGVAEGVAGWGGGAGAGTRARRGGVGCASGGRSVSQSVRAPASPASSARPRQRPGLAPPPLRLPESLAPFSGSSLGPPAGPAWPGVGQPVSASLSTRHLALLAWSLPLPPLALCLWLPLSPIYEARSHHVLMSLCPALAAAAAQTPPRELRGEGPARGARGSKLCWRWGPAVALALRPEGLASPSGVTYFSSSSPSYRPPLPLRSRGTLRP